MIPPGCLRVGLALPEADQDEATGTTVSQHLALTNPGWHCSAESTTVRSRHSAPLKRCERSTVITKGYMAVSTSSANCGLPLGW